MCRRLVPASFLLVCAFVALLVVFSNHYDWDVFYALNEVDRRAWLIDRELPLWTYQLCGGMSRIADPQAFGLSPLFVLVLAFGSFWGNKLWVLASLGIGVYFAAKLFELCGNPERERPGPWTPHLVPAALFVFGNYFMWHLLVGHFTFAAHFVGLAIIYLTLAGYWRGLSRREFGIGVLVSWQHYAGGFFHSLVYLMVPFFIAFALFVGIDLLARRARSSEGARAPIDRLWGAGAFQAVGMLLALPKLWAVWSYSRAIRRNLEPSLIEAASPDRIARHLATPTLNLDWLLPVPGPQLHAVHEYSSFSLLVPLALAAGVIALTGRPAARTPPSRRPWNGAVTFACVYLAVAGLLAMGDLGSWAPFALLNDHLFRGAVRIASRFEVGIVLAAGIVFAAVSRSGPASRLASPGAGLAVLALLALNLATFLPLTSVERLHEVLALPATPHARMREWSVYPIYPSDHKGVGGELHRANTSQMYGPVLLGRGIDNCYNALPVRRKRPPTTGVLPLIDARVGMPGRACVEASYYTQNRVILAEECPELTCVNISWLNPLQRDPPLLELPSIGRYCWDRRPLRAGARGARLR
jgi:hypothetical protein